MSDTTAFYRQNNWGTWIATTPTDLNVGDPVRVILDGQMHETTIHSVTESTVGFTITADIRDWGAGLV